MPGKKGLSRDIGAYKSSSLSLSLFLSLDYEFRGLPPASSDAPITYASSRVYYPRPHRELRFSEDETPGFLGNF